MDSLESVQVSGFVRIASLENELPKLDGEQLLKSIAPETRGCPLAVISVIGGTEEQRGAAVKALVGCLYKGATDEIAHDREVDGIFAVIPPGKITNDAGKEIAVLILDISCSHDASTAYSKLANLCLLVSSVVIYTASCSGEKITNVNIHMPELKSVGPSALTINHLWVIVQDCDSLHCSKANEARLLTYEYENPDLSERTKEVEVSMLTRFSYSNFRMRFLLDRRSNDSHDYPLQGRSAEGNEALKETCSSILKNATQIPGVHLGQVISHLKAKWSQVALASANDSCESSSQDSHASVVNNQSQDDARPSEPITQLDSCPVKKDKIEIKDAEPRQMDSMNQASQNENEEGKLKQSLGFGTIPVSNETHTRDQGKEKGRISPGGYVPETGVNDSKTVSIQTNKSASTSSSASGLLKKFFKKPTNPPAHSETHDVLPTIVCDPTKAVQDSLERYNEEMEKFLHPHEIYADQDIRAVHKPVSQCVLDAFSTPTFEKAKEKLQDSLSTSLQERLEANFAKMRKLDKKEEKLRQMCGMYYKDKMSTKMSEKTVPSDKAREFHKQAMRDTKQWFRTHCKDVLKPIKDDWEKVLDVRFDFWKTYYMDEFAVKLDLPPITGFSLSAPNEQQSKKASVGIYFGPDVVQFGLYSSDIEVFKRSCVEILPIISFKDDKILIGDEAKSCGTQEFNVFDIISRPTSINNGKDVKIYARDFNLRDGEIAVLFFREAKEKFESIVKTQAGTCAVAASGLLPSASKQGLTSALRMSGFSRVKFIPSATAILVWYLKQRQAQSCKKTTNDPEVLVIHHTGTLVEVAKVAISVGQDLSMKKLGGFLNYNDFNQPNQVKVLRSAIHEAIVEAEEQSKDFEQTVIIQGSQGDETIKGYIDKVIGGKLHEPLRELQTQCHIAFSAAAYDAHNNGDESVSSFPKFNHLITQELSIRTASRKWVFPSPPYEFHFESHSSFTICESYKSKEITFYLCHSSPPAIKLDVTWRDDGTFKISGAPLMCLYYQFITDSDLESVWKQVNEVVLEKKRFVETHKGSCHTNPPHENAAGRLQTLQGTLWSQLEDVKQRLKVSGNSIKPLILEGIEDRIKACEKLLSQLDVKEKQLSIAIGQLEVASNRIPSKN